MENTKKVSLQHLQKKFLKVVTGRNVRDLDWIKPGGPLTRVERSQVYSYAFYERLKDSLRDDFSTVVLIIGKKRSEELFSQYLVEFPPSSYSLILLGKNLSLFIKTQKKLITDFPFLLDLIEFEYLVTRSFFAPDFTMPKALLENTKWRLRDSAFIFDSKWSLKSIWGTSRRPKKNKKSSFLIFRPGAQINVRLLKDDEAKVLKSLKTAKFLDNIFKKTPLKKSEKWVYEWAKSQIIEPISPQQS